jgi:hypothetical protein
MRMAENSDFVSTSFTQNKNNKNNNNNNNKQSLYRSGQAQRVLGG